MNQYSDSQSDFSDVDEDESVLQASDLTQGEEIFQDELYCVACNKFFNSESAKLNHEASKKHKQNTELLKAEMNSEEDKYQQNLKAENNIELSGDEANESEVEEEIFEQPGKKSKGKKSKKKNKKTVSYEESESVQEKSADEEEETAPTETKLIESDDDDWSSSKKSKKSKAKTKTKPDRTKIEPEPEKFEELSIESATEGESSENRCVTCNAAFPSNNKLFAHLKKTNHSVYLGEKSSAKKSK